MEAMTRYNHSNFVFSFVYKDTKEAQNELPNHFHNFCEFIYVHSGKGVFFIKNKFYEMGKGDLFIIPDDTIHHTNPDKHNLITSSVMFFSPVLLQNIPLDDSFSYAGLLETIKKKGDYKISLPSKNRIHFENYLLTIQNEFKEKKTGSLHQAVLILQQMLIDLSRITIQKEDNPRQAHKITQSWIYEILPYIEKNLYKPISLTELANEALVSPAHFSRVFKEVTGMGLTVYINQRRILRAKELLLATRQPIASIAQQCGFENTPHFYRTFKKYTGNTPAEFRER